MIKTFNVRRRFAAFAFAASLTTGWMAVAFAQDTTNQSQPAEECPFADTENGSCRHAATEPTTDGPVITDPESAAQAEKVAICHRPGTPAQKTLFVALIATPAHMGHGDTPGPCGDDPR